MERMVAPAGGRDGHDREDDRGGAGGERQGEGEGQDRGLSRDRLVLLVMVARVEGVGDEVDDAQQDEDPRADLGQEVLVVLQLHHLPAREGQGGADADIDHHVDQAGRSRDGQHPLPAPPLRLAHQDEAEPMTGDEGMEQRHRECGKKGEGKAFHGSGIIHAGGTPQMKKGRPCGRPS
jgi:hypothetical protein